MNLKLFKRKLEEAVKKAFSAPTEFGYETKDSNASAEVKRLVEFYTKRTGKILALEFSREQIAQLELYYRQARNAFIVPTFETTGYAADEQAQKFICGLTGLQDQILWRHYVDRDDDYQLIIPREAVFPIHPSFEEEVRIADMEMKLPKPEIC